MEGRNFHILSEGEGLILPSPRSHSFITFLLYPSLRLSPHQSLPAIYLSLPRLPGSS